MTIKSSLLIAILVHICILAFPGLQLDVREKARAKSIGVVIGAGGDSIAKAGQGGAPETAVARTPQASQDVEQVRKPEKVAHNEPSKTPPKPEPEPEQKPKPEKVAVKAEAKQKPTFEPREQKKPVTDKKPEPAMQPCAEPKPEPQKEPSQDEAQSISPEPEPREPETEPAREIIEQALESERPAETLAHGRSKAQDAAIAATEPGGGQEQTGPPRFGLGDLNGPDITGRPALEYPSKARRMGVEGVVLVEVLIDEQGRAVKAEVVDGLGFGLDRAARDFVLKCRFKPAEQGGEAITSIAEIPIRFNLR
jgi:protein TonB